MRVSSYPIPSTVRSTKYYDQVSFVERFETSENSWQHVIGHCLLHLNLEWLVEISDIGRDERHRSLSPQRHQTLRYKIPYPHRISSKAQKQTRNHTCISHQLSLKRGPVDPNLCCWSVSFSPTSLQLGQSRVLSIHVDPTLQEHSPPATEHPMTVPSVTFGVHVQERKTTCRTAFVSSSNLHHITLTPISRSRTSNPSRSSLAAASSTSLDGRWSIPVPPAGDRTILLSTQPT